MKKTAAVDRAGAVRQGHGTGTDSGDNAVRASTVRRNAWLLGGLAVLFYVGYIAWMFVRASGGALP